MQPGQTITPTTRGSEDKPTHVPEPHHTQKHEDHEAEPASFYRPNQADSAAQAGFYRGDYANELHPDHGDSIRWSASEYVDHEKQAGWFGMLALGTVVFAALLYLITNDFVTVVMILLAGGLFAAGAARKPRTLNYELDAQGLVVGSKFFPYETFKSFSVIQEDAINSILLLPLKRFMPPISLYYPPEQEESLLVTLSNFLPHEERSHDQIDRLMRRIRF